MDKSKNKFLPILLIILIIINIFSLQKINNMQNKIITLDNTVQRIQSNIHQSINSGIHEMAEIQKKDNSIISSFDYSFGKLKDKRIDLILSVKPKTINKDDKFFFSYKTFLGEGEDEDNKPSLIEAISEDGINFKSKINISIFDTVNLDFIIDDGVSKKTETLDPIYEPLDKYGAQIRLEPYGNSIRYDNKKMIISTSYRLSNYIYHDDYYNNTNVVLETPKLSLYKNDKLMEDFNFVEYIEDNNIQHIDEDNRYRIDLKNYNLDVEPGDIILLQVTTKDDQGFKYTINVDGWKVIDEKSHESLDWGMESYDYKFHEIIIE